MREVGLNGEMEAGVGTNVTTPSERALWKRQTIYNFWSKLICPKSTTRQTLVEVTDTLFRLQEREAVLDPAPWQWPGGVAVSLMA